MRLKLTDATVRTLPPSPTQTKYWDTVTKGFGVRVNGASKSWIVMFGKSRNLKVLGHYPTTSLADARRAAKVFLLSPDEKGSPTFAEALTTYLETQTHLAAATRRDYTRILKNCFEPSLRSVQLSAIGTRDITHILDELSDRPAEQKYAHSVIRRFFKWAVGRRLLDRSPLDGLDIPKPTKPRERALSEEELRAVWNAAADDNFGRVVKLAILTGQRRGALAALRGEWVDRSAKTITWPSHATKQRRQHVIPIGDTAIALIPLGQGVLFQGRGVETEINGWSKAMAALIKRAGIPHFVLHDLRRTAATMWAKLRIDRDVREFLLGHTLKGIEGVYDRWDRMPEMREAIEKWEAHLLTIL